MNPIVGKNPPWAPKEDERLRALALSGASVAEMAKQMKRSEEAIRSRAYRLKIVVAKSRNKWLRLKAREINSDRTLGEHLFKIGTALDRFEFIRRFR